MRRLPLALATTLTLVTLAGCGGDEAAAPTPSATASSSPSAATLTKAQYIEQGDAICARLEADTDEVPAPTDETTGFAAYIDQVVGLAEGAKTSFAALEPPPDGAAVHKTLLDSLTAAITSAQGAATAARGGDTVSAGDLLTEAQRAGDASDQAAQAYGFTECGSETTEDEGSDAPASGSDGSAALSKEEFIAQGDAICARLDDELTALGQPASEEELASYLAEVIALGESGLDDLAGLAPPPDGEQVHADLQLALARGLETLAGAKTAAESGDTVTAGDLLTQASAEGSAADEAADAYGFTSCGSTS